MEEILHGKYDKDKPRIHDLMAECIERIEHIQQIEYTGYIGYIEHIFDTQAKYLI